jgi:hypothetical protein
MKRTSFAQVAAATLVLAGAAPVWAQSAGEGINPRQIPQTVWAIPPAPFNRSTAFPEFAPLSAEWSMAQASGAPRRPVNRPIGRWVAGAFIGGLVGVGAGALIGGSIASIASNGRGQGHEAGAFGAYYGATYGGLIGVPIGIALIH